ncbi:MAG: hypothetical protein HFJ19_04950 [Clostridia bacterium]|nr:hypothetical protein [Clostridia bacterium]
MKKNWWLLVIGALVTYLAFFAGSDFSKLSTILDFVLTAGIATAFIFMLYAVVVSKRAE